MLFTCLFLLLQANYAINFQNEINVFTSGFGAGVFWQI